MLRKPFKFVTTLLLTGIGTVVHALPASLDAGNVVIDYDIDTFAVNVDGYSIDPSFASVLPVANGVILGFGGQLNVTGSSYTYYSTDTRSADYSAQFSFTPEAGKAITGYYITYTGTYDIESPGSVALGGPGVSLNEYGGYGTPFSITSFIAGSVAPSLTGYLQATGDVGYISVFDHTEEVLVGYIEVLDYCDPEELGGTCYYRQEPQYEYVDVYREEMDLGLASINLESITLTASVVPVPPALVLFGSALAGLGSRRLLKRA